MTILEPLHVASHGKLLITGEYAVLHGARALAVPVKFKQHLYVQPHLESHIKWESILPDGSVWMEATYTRDLKHQTSGRKTSESRLIQNILSVIHRMQPHLFRRGYSLRSVLEFSPEWGMGTSSSLVANLAKWTQVNPFDLLDQTFGGSGYDVAVATGGKHLLFEYRDGRRRWCFTEWKPRFRKHIYFVHLNRKQNTAKVLKKYRNLRFRPEQIERITAISEEIVHCHSRKRFRELIDEHESLIGKVLQRKPVRETLFPDFEGSIKSLGAWGGDMIMAVGDGDTPAYFRDKGYPVIFSYKDLIAPA
ncbi:MAG: hypothetical protein GXO24_02705 [Chlorobi bacterium]|nr:hypothetical protein [Chlorobiota bacterium]